VYGASDNGSIPYFAVLIREAIAITDVNRDLIVNHTFRHTFRRDIDRDFAGPVSSRHGTSAPELATSDLPFPASFW
jgi:hypothetical protein